MQTKLMYIENLIRTRAMQAHTDPKAYNLQADLQSEFDNLRVKNQETGERVRKLKVIHSCLSSNSAAVDHPKDSKLAEQVELAGEYFELATELQKQQTGNESFILKLQRQVAAMDHKLGEIGGSKAI